MCVWLEVKKKSRCAVFNSSDESNTFDVQFHYKNIPCRTFVCFYLVNKDECLKAMTLSDFGRE